MTLQQHKEKLKKYIDLLGVGCPLFPTEVLKNEIEASPTEYFIFLRIMKIDLSVLHFLFNNGGTEAMVFDFMKNIDLLKKKYFSIFKNKKKMIKEYPYLKHYIQRGNYV